jgi:asparagine synthase (glutamine-hydrolysing)
MCGIAGMLLTDRHAAVSAELLGRMAHSLRHRGPDDEGVWTEGRVGLVNRRLAILDVSARGHQPMSNEDSSIWITFNGEIYNFQELRARLLARGHSFRSNTDTETIIHLYEEEGADCVRSLRGMFAFALWDGRTQTLLAARDRLGKKPLFYYSDAGRVMFASEPKALLQDRSVPVSPDRLAIHHYLTYGYVPTPWSAFTRVRKLPPAHYLTVKDGQLSLHRYWTLRHTPKPTRSAAALGEELLALLEEVVRLRLVSDVPLGALLSGGLDSSVVVAMMRRTVSGPLQTFSIGFEQPRYDELSYARQVAQRFETEHHELVVKPNAVAMLPRLVWHYNEPFADSSAVPSFLLSEMVRRFVPVALNGDGGDEAFMGYERYRAAAIAGRYDWVPASMRRTLGAASRRPLSVGGTKSVGHRARRFFEALGLSPARRYGQWMTCFSQVDKHALYSSDMLAEVADVDSLELLDAAYASSDGVDFVEASADTDMRMYLPDDLLVKMDIASMAHSLEMRSPLLDYRLIEFAAALPVELKLRGSTQKVLLKQVMADVLPASILTRRKMGFGVPIGDWLRLELKDMAYDLLLDSRATSRGYFRPAAIRRLLDEHTQQRAQHHFRLWSLLMLELWHRVFIDQPCPVAPAATAPDASVLV